MNARQYGIRIYTIVVGKDGVVPFPPPDGQIEMVESHVNTSLTRQIAEITGGEFYTATDQKALSRIYDRIDSLEKSESETHSIMIRKPLYQFPVTLALGLLAIFSIASQMRRESYVF